MYIKKHFVVCIKIAIYSVRIRIFDQKVYYGQLIFTFFLFNFFILNKIQILIYP